VSSARRRRPARLLLALALTALAACAGPGLTPPSSPFVPTPEAVADAMLAMAEVGPADVVYDLGSGDGRLVIAAARRFGARGVGVELDPALVHASRESALRAGVADRVRFLWQDLFTADLREATVVTLYLGEAVNRRLVPKLLAELRPGARVVSHDFDLGDWRPDLVRHVRGPDRDHRLLLWRVPASVDGDWALTLDDGRQGTVRLRQRFQDVTGVLALGGREVPLGGEVAGDLLRLTGGGWRLEGRVSGDRLSGEAAAPDAVPQPCQAERRRR
jgi:SAM-dependent methyltransferase